MNAEPPLVTMAGAGFVLPGYNTPACHDIATFSSIVTRGTSCLSPYAHPGLPLQLAGQVGAWDIAGVTGVDERRLARISPAAQMALGAVTTALANAGLVADDFDARRSLIVLSSLQFASPEAQGYHSTIAAEGPAAVKAKYWNSGTPASVVGTVSATLGIPAATLSVAGSCNVALRAVHLVNQLIAADEIDRALVVGVDTTTDPVFVAGTTHEWRSGYRASSLSAEAGDIRPHDAWQTGNATGEGAAALVLERTSLARSDTDKPQVRLSMRTSRSNGPTAVATGPADVVAADMLDLIARDDCTWDGLGFVNDYADGNRFVEDHWCDAVASVRQGAAFDGQLLVTNQEAVFGHVAGTGGLVKLIASVDMLARGRAAPSAGCVEPYRRLEATPVGPAGSPIDADAALVVTSGAGGDTTSALVRLERGRF